MTLGPEIKSETISRKRAAICVCALIASACSERAPASLSPGRYQSPLVLQQRLQGQVGHLHIDEIRYRASDARLFQCSYTFGVIDARDASGMRYLAENLRHSMPNDRRRPGCIHLAWDGDLVYTTHRGNLSNPTFVSGWDISTRDPEDPRRMQPTQLPVLQEAGESYEGIDVANGFVYVALKDRGLGVYRRNEKTNVLSRVGSIAGLGSTRGNTTPPRSPRSTTCWNSESSASRSLRGRLPW
jgi:hypothetical protein